MITCGISVVHKLLIASSNKEKFPQVVGELVLVPWGHHRIIIDKFKTIEKCLFYITHTIEGNLSRNDLERMIFQVKR